MNFKEKLSPSAQKKLSDLLFIFYAGGAALLSYSLVYALRKPFTAATFDGMELFGMDYKVATSIIQIFGYMVSKFIGIKLISELKREGRLKFILVSIGVAELSLVLFGCLPRPFNVLALFFNGLSLGCMWGVIFSFLEGRRVTDLLASLFGLSIAVSSGTAKSIGLFVVDILNVSEFWMPALIGAVALPLLAGLGYILDHLPKPTAEDKALRVERVTLDRQQRWELFRNFAPVLTLLFFANLFLTVLQDVKEDFLVKIIDVNAAGLSSWVFAKVDGVVTLIILAVFATLALVKSHIKVLSTLLTLVIAGVTLDRQQRWELFRNFAPVLTLLFFANLFLTVLQDVKEDFLVKIIDVNAAGLSSWVFAKVDGVVTLIILAVFATLALVKSHIKVLSTLLTLVIAGAVTLSFVAFNYDSLQLSPLVWLFIQSLCLYFSYLSFQTIFFDRFIACFRIRGNVGFFIAMVDSIGYTGTVLVLVFKECFNPNLDWLEFYNTMAGTVGIVCCTAFTVSLFYLMQRYRKGKRKEIREKATSCPVPSLASSY